MNAIIGIHMGHDASVTLIKDRKIVSAVSEERFVREKMYYGFPFLALEDVLNRYGISPDEVEIVALDTNELARIIGPEEMQRRFQKGTAKDVTAVVNKAKRFLSYFVGNRPMEQQIEREKESKRVLFRKLEEYGFPASRIRTYDHHKCHAASAFWPSPFEKAMFATSDGRGDGLSASLGFASGNSIETTRRIADIDSIGQFYAAMTFYLGFRPNRHEGKVTGLAAHGDPMRFGPQFLSNVNWNKDGTYSFRVPQRFRLDTPADLDEFLEKMPLSLKDRVVIHTQNDLNTLMYTSNWYSLLAYLQTIASPDEREDLAAGVQFLVESVCVEFVKRNLPEEPLPIVLAGGVFSNVRVNQRIREISGITNVYVQPAMGDDGLSLGAALLALAENDPNAASFLSESQRSVTVGHTYLGPEFSADEILRACQEEGVVPTRIPEIEKQIARWIHEGVVVGHFDGRMEFGPRALGHRSILVRPTDKSVNQSLNKRFRRTEFMPFAPSAISEYARDYFIDYRDDHVASEYMTITYNIPTSKQNEIQAVVHVDGTARPQIVFKEKEPRYHRIISEYQKLSGIPVIINTSFNMHEEPIVCSPQDAIRSMKANCVDVLVMNDYVVRLGEHAE